MEQDEHTTKHVNTACTPAETSHAIPTVKSFVFRFGLMASTGAVIGTYTLISFYRLAALVTPVDQKMISRYGVPVGSLGGLVYTVSIFLIAAPMIRYIRRVQAGEQLEEKYVFDVQDKALNLGYKMAAVASLFYILFNPVAFYVGVTSIGWAYRDVMVYNLAGTAICSLIMIPIGINFGSWSVRPVVNYTALQVQSDPARRAGWKLSLGFRLLLTFMPIITALLLYACLVGYSQTKNIFDNMKRMENAYLDESEKAGLIDAVVHRTDPGVRSSEHFQTHVKRLKTSYYIFMVMGIGGSLLFTFLAAIETTRPLRILTKASEKIKEGRLHESVRLVTTDETADLGSTFNRMMSTIKKQMNETETLLEKLQKGIVEIDGTVMAIVPVCAEQSAGASHQAATAQQASSVAGEFVATAKSIEDRANSVDEVAASTLAACRNGESKLNQAESQFRNIAEQVEAISDKMDKLDKKFRYIYTIMTYFENMTEQTELLAFNASLEAVGAGKHGRRFMVVAQATRRLALKSADTAKEIKNMIETIETSTTEAKEVAKQGKEKVASGAQAIIDVVNAFKNISNFAGSTSSAVKEISITTRQQTTASEQLEEAVGEILRVAKRVELGAKSIDKTIADLSNFAETLRNPTGT